MKVCSDPQPLGGSGEISVRHEFAKPLKPRIIKVSALGDDAAICVDKVIHARWSKETGPLPALLPALT